MIKRNKNHLSQDLFTPSIVFTMMWRENTRKKR